MIWVIRLGSFQTGESENVGLVTMANMKVEAMSGSDIGKGSH